MPIPSAHDPAVKEVDAPGSRYLNSKDMHVNMEAGEPPVKADASMASSSNLPRVHITGKRYWPVLEMLRFHWLPGEQLLLLGGWDLEEECVNRLTA